MASSAAPSDGFVASPSAVPTIPAASFPVSVSPSAAPLPSASTLTGASACSGNHDNRTFFDEIAAQVSWDVYCAVLPSGWFVQTGSFSLRDSGRLEITYTGPNSASLSLQEGNFCSQGAGACAPHSTVLGSTAFGDRTGQFVSVGGGYAVYVDPGDNPSWMASGHGLDQGTFVTLAAALHKVTAQP